MVWISVLIALVTAMVALEGIGAERNFRRSQDTGEPRAWEQELLDELLFGRAR
jgi:hypothetical protein